MKSAEMAGVQRDELPQWLEDYATSDFGRFRPWTLSKT